MNEENKVTFGLANITIGEGDEAITFDASDLEVESGEITLVPNYKDIDVSDFGSPKSFDFEGSLEMPEYAIEKIERMSTEFRASLGRHINNLLQEVIDHFGVTDEDQKDARINHVYGGPTGDYSNVYINDELVATYVPNELPFKYKKFF